MKNFDFENPKVRIKADIILVILLTLFAFGMVLYNAFLPNNTVIECNKDFDKCEIIYSNISGHSCIKKDITFKISNIEDVEFIPTHKMSSRSHKYANINIITKDRQFYNDVMQPSINEDDTKFLAERIKEYLNNSNNTFQFNRNEEINPITRKGYILGILIYYMIAIIFGISDICYYKKRL